MKWGRETDYHGSRRYALDEPAVGRLSLVLAWLADGAKRGFRYLVAAGARESSSDVLLFNGEHRFTLLGTRNRKAAGEMSKKLPFPTRPAGTDHNWRVMP